MLCSSRSQLVRNLDRLVGTTYADRFISKLDCQHCKARSRMQCLRMQMSSTSHGLWRAVSTCLIR